MAAEQNLPDLRAQVDIALGNGAFDRASLLMKQLWRSDHSGSVAGFLAARLDQHKDKLASVSCKLAILRSFTVEPIVPLLRAEAFSYGAHLTVQIGDFNSYALDILDPESPLYRFEPDAVILAVRTAEIAPDLWSRFAQIDIASAKEATARVVKSFEQWISTFRQRTQAALIVHALEMPAEPAFGILDGQSTEGQSACIAQINQELRRIAAGHRGVYVLDYDRLVSRHGSKHWNDDRRWLTARLPIAASHLLDIAREWVRFLVPLTGRIGKALAVDLDNTLWGGVIGEDGLTGIRLGPEYPGAAYQALQRVMLDLQKRGILLAICSKNNADDAMEALEKHPGMLVQPKDFACLRINWSEKGENLREIARELNIGIDSLVFVDDNPFEREQVRSAVPEVTVLDLPENPMEYATAVRECPLFERLSLSVEDQKRSAMYAEQRERAQVEQGFQSKEDFFRYLEQEAEIAPVSELTLARVAQLTQKTNQFNLTTRRYSEQQIADLKARPDWQVLSLKVKDRFGDHGLVGVVIAHDNGERCEIDTFLMSCRVIGRTIESALLSYVADGARRRGCRQLVGRFVPTKKNAPAKDFYQQHGFEAQDANGDGSLWTLDLGRATVKTPEWIKLSTGGGKN